MSASEVRTRMAPSPTGELHLGGVRTALFSWLWAKHTGGKFYLRIEDTDQNRLVPGSVERIYDSLLALAMRPDDYNGNPYIKQSDLLAVHQAVAHRLVAEGKAYYCFASPEELEAMRQEQQANHLPPRYDNRWGYRDLALAEAQARIEQGEAYVVRQKMPLAGTINFTDAIHGEIKVEATTFDDHVLLKADGYPTYHLASVVDDHAMEITHVIRGQEWLPSAPRHAALYSALGWEPPIFLHAPVILGPDKGKLSKRHGARSVLEYCDEGYLPEALINFLVLLGWSSGTEDEVFSGQELIERFSLDGIHASPAHFDTARLTWFNATHIRRLSLPELEARLLTYWQDRNPIWGERAKADPTQFTASVQALHERLTTLKEFGELAEVFYTDPTDYPADLILGKKQTPDEAKAALQAAWETLGQVSNWTHETLETNLRQLAESKGWKAGDVLWPLRVALTGLPASPGVFEMLVILGPDASLRRVSYALSLFE